MAKAKKLKSGNWNVRVFEYRDENGKAYFKSITAPTKAEAEYLAAIWRQERPTRPKNADLARVYDVVDKYINGCKTLSPSTVFRYEQMLRRRVFPELLETRVADLSREVVQDAINNEANRRSEQTGRKLSAKTIRNEWGLVSAALGEVCGLSYSVKLPKQTRRVKMYPEPSEVLDVILGSDIELPCLLSMWCSFSMSELRGLKCSSVRRGCVYVNQVRITVGGEDIEKQNAKTATRNRAQALPPYLLEKIEALPVFQEYKHGGPDAYLVPESRNVLYKRWKKISAAAGLDLTFHDLRHMSASIMLALNIPEKYAMERGGWSTPATMKRVYQHTFSTQRQKADALVNDYFAALISSKK